MSEDGIVTKISRSLISALPPAFIVLVLLNVVFIGVVMWFLKDQLEQRDMMAEKLFDRCMDIALKHTP